jgi:hypothetical protein
VAALLRRRDAIRESMPMGMGNLAIAQHRQSMQYLHRRDGSYRQTGATFAAGMYAVGNIRNKGNLDIRADPSVLRVLCVMDGGFLILQGAAGAVLRDNCTNWAPLHASDVVGRIEPALVAARIAREVDDIERKCWVCNDATSELDAFQPDRSKDYRSIICDQCENMFHLACVGLSELPATNVWFCPTCVRLFPPDGAATMCTAAVDMLSVAALNPLDSPGALGALLHELMLGAWGPAHVTRLFNCLPGQVNVTSCSTRRACRSASSRCEGKWTPCWVASGWVPCLL